MTQLKSRVIFVFCCTIPLEIKGLNVNFRLFSISSRKTAQYLAAAYKNLLPARKTGLFMAITCFDQLASRICKLRCLALDPQTLVPGYIEYMHSVTQ